jgi:hypothetical protein
MFLNGKDKLDFTAWFRGVRCTEEHSAKGYVLAERQNIVFIMQAVYLKIYRYPFICPSVIS